MLWLLQANGKTIFNRTDVSSLTFLDTGVWFAIHPRGLKQYLQVILRIPVRIENYAGISSCEVDAQTSRPGAEKEHKTIRIRLAKAVDGGLSQIATHPPINTLIEIPARKRYRILLNTDVNLWTHPSLLQTPTNLPLVRIFFIKKKQKPGYHKFWMNDVTMDHIKKLRHT